MSVHDMGTTSGFQANQGVKRGNSLGVRSPSQNPLFNIYKGRGRKRETVKNKVDTLPA
ncbi:hypothetical protein QJS10_CPA07g00356 [Acorus calamus]|uniref:Uncharacterized protein n=1 Tax=Acorus calamus TaxID=4465 RepID=A0AAV9EHJ4_ACOCL|nr:hypothetical protein QJS10_CPA07g00356 [Acorus calamus]